MVNCASLPSCTGDVDRLRRFWLTGVCKSHKQERQFSEPLATEQFLSAFLLLLCGIGLAIFLLGLEHVYFVYIRAHLAKTNTGCCSLISLVRQTFKNTK
jgi:ionotropic glutamate receptor NMDA 2B